MISKTIKGFLLPKENKKPDPTYYNSNEVKFSSLIRNNGGSFYKRYRIEAEIGYGTYGSVSRAVSLATRRRRAVKVLSKDNIKNIPRIRNEISIMKNLDHPNVVKLHETFEDFEKIFICMDYCSGGELFDRIMRAGHISEKESARLFWQMLIGISYLHSHGIIHRDLKPENFLFSCRGSNVLKIIDFGLSKDTNKSPMPCSTKAGTPYYVAPEVLNGKHGMECDLWSCGVILHMMLSGYPPFCGENDQMVLKKVKQGKCTLDSPEWNGISNGAKDLVTRLLTVDPKLRCTVKEALSHPWMTANNVALYTPVNRKDSTVLQCDSIPDMKEFRKHNVLRRAALTLCAANLPDKEKVALNAVFFSLDTDYTGVLYSESNLNGCKSSTTSTSSTTADGAAESVEASVDSSLSVVAKKDVSYTEFIAAAMDMTVVQRRSMLLGVFSVFDLEGNGSLSKSALVSILKAFHPTTLTTLQAVDMLLEDYDTDKKDAISFDEFCRMVRCETLGSTSDTHSIPVPPKVPPMSKFLRKLLPFLSKSDSGTTVVAKNTVAVLPVRSQSSGIKKQVTAISTASTAFISTAYDHSATTNTTATVPSTTTTATVPSTTTTATVSSTTTTATVPSTTTTATVSRTAATTSTSTATVPSTIDCISTGIATHAASSEGQQCVCSPWSTDFANGPRDKRTTTCKTAITGRSDIDQSANKVVECTN
eukprot:Lankesteria_metandrocarpae@DN3386_c0_g1_i3.p1